MRAVTSLILGSFLACAHTPQSGIMVGLWTPEKGTGQKVPMSWESVDDSHGRIHATLGKGGEHFHGQYVRVTADHDKAQIQLVYNEWAPADYALDWNAEGNYGVGEVVTLGDFVNHFSGKVVATLMGDRNHSMRCSFEESVPVQGMVAGGVGHCRVSDGGQIDVEF